MQPNNEDTSNLMQTVIGNQAESTKRFFAVIEEQQRISRRTSRFLWTGLAVSLLVSLVLLFFVYRISNGAAPLPGSMQPESERMARMEQSFILMTENLEEIQAAMLSINGYMQNINQDIHKLNEISTPLVSIDNNMLRLSNSIGLIESGITSLDRNTGELNSTMGIVANQLGQMTHDVNRMTKPRMMFPFD